MANYWYVKSGGSLGVNSDTPYSSKQTGSFAGLTTANYFDNTKDVLDAGTKTTPIAAGDYILVSDAHSHNYGAVNTTLSFVANVSNNPVKLISVSDTAIDTSNPGAAETTDNTYDLWLQYAHYTEGMTFNSGDSFQCMINQANGRGTLRDCTINMTRPAAYYCAAMGNLDGNIVELYNCTFNFANTTGSGLTGYRVGTVFMYGGAVTGATGMLYCIESSNSNGKWVFDSVDFSGINGASSFLVEQAGSGDDALDVTFIRCKLHANTGLLNGSVGSPDCHIKMFACDSGDTYYNRQEITYWGELNDETSVTHVGGGTLPDGTTLYGLKVATTSNTLAGVLPARFALSEFWNDFSASGSDTVRVYCVSTDSGLTDNDVWIEVEYPDGTIAADGQRATSRNTDVLASGTALSGGTLGDWNNNTGYTAYEIAVTTSSGGEGQGRVFVCVAKPSISVIFDSLPTVE